jgi:hypothetical protein
MDIFGLICFLPLLIIFQYSFGSVDLRLCIFCLIFFYVFEYNDNNLSEQDSGLVDNSSVNDMVKKIESLLTISAKTTFGTFVPE